MRASFSCAVTALAMIAASSVSGVAQAGEPDPADAAFRRGIALMESGSINEACIAFEQSERIEAKAGTLLNLAGCYERASRWEDAYRTFERARDAARARSRADWESVATEHLAALRSKLSIVTLDTTGRADLAAARVTVDGRVLSEGELARGLALGIGPHVLKIEARGYRSYEQTLVTPPDAALRIPALQPEAAKAELAPGAAAPASDGAPAARKTFGVVLAATGGAALGFMAASSVIASGALSDAKGACTSYPDHCSPAASSANDRARTWSTIGTVSLVSGVALVVVGAALYLWPSSTSSSAPRASGASGATVPDLRITF